MKVKLTIETARAMYSEGGSGKSFALDNYSESELVKKPLPKTWDELGRVEGYYVSNYSIAASAGIRAVASDNKNVFSTLEEAEASIALAQLSQLRKVYNNGWEPNWNEDGPKYVIYYRADNISSRVSFHGHHFLAFKTPEIRDEFLSNFRDLIEQAMPLL